MVPDVWRIRWVAGNFQKEAGAGEGRRNEGKKKTNTHLEGFSLGDQAEGQKGFWGDA